VTSPPCQRLAPSTVRCSPPTPRASPPARAIGHTAQPHDAPPFDRRRAHPGVGNRLACVRLDDMQDRHRFPRGQDGVSSGRLGTWAHALAPRASKTAPRPAREPVPQPPCGASALIRQGRRLWPEGNPHLAQAKC
jgi:hypothetical protein